MYCTRGLVAVCTGSAVLCLSSSSPSTEGGDVFIYVICYLIFIAVDVQDVF